MDILKTTILLVEDEPATAKIHSEQLKKTGYNVIHAYTGIEAINTTTRNHNLINIILMDIELGEGIDGVEVAEIILKKYDIPIVFFSSHSEEEVVSRTSRLPSYGFVLKNTGIAMLDAAIKMAINLHNSHNKAQLKDEQEKEARYKDLVDNAGEAIFVAQNGILKLVNPATCELTGYTEDELYSNPFSEIIYHEDRSKVIENHLKRISGNQVPTCYQFRIKTKDNALKWVEINSILYRWSSKPATLNFLTNITERKEIEDALRESEIKYRKIFENVQDVFYQTDSDGNIIEISPSIERYSYYAREELLGRPVTDVYFNPEDRNEMINLIRENGEVIDYELRLRDKHYRDVFTSTNSHFIYDVSGNIIGVEGSLRDISARKHVELALKESLKQKELLMIELQHRVKNNLGIISSLLSLEMPKLNDEYAREVFINARTRILSMSVIYEQLYSSGNLDSVNLATYISGLADMILKTYSISSKKINLHTELAEVQLDLRRTVPLGLILNELITNVLKYAYPDSAEGDIKIDLFIEGEIVTFALSDCGIGLPEGFKISSAETMGLSLVRMLVSQINGTLDVENSGGTMVRISFEK